jgi:hypothetical protein
MKRFPEGACGARFAGHRVWLAARHFLAFNPLGFQVGLPFMAAYFPLERALKKPALKLV